MDIDRVFSVEDITGDSKPPQFSLLIKSSNKSFVVFCKDEAEKNSWFKDLQDAVSQFAGTIQTAQSNTAKVAAVREGNDSTKCGICSKKFSVIVRRLNCRACGGVCCADCVKQRMILRGIKDKYGNMITEAKRICDRCVANGNYAQKPVPPSYDVNGPAYQWTVEQVNQFLCAPEISMDPYAHVFQAQHIDGKALLELDDSSLRDRFEISDSALRQRLLKTLKVLNLSTPVVVPAAPPTDGKKAYSDRPSLPPSLMNQIQSVPAGGKVDEDDDDGEPMFQLGGGHSSASSRPPSFSGPISSIMDIPAAPPSAGSTGSSNGSNSRRPSLSGSSGGPPVPPARPTAPPVPLRGPNLSKFGSLRGPLSAADLEKMESSFSSATSASAKSSLNSNSSDDNDDDTTATAGTPKGNLVGRNSPLSSFDNGKVGTVSGRGSPQVPIPSRAPPLTSSGSSSSLRVPPSGLAISSTSGSSSAPSPPPSPPQHSPNVPTGRSSPSLFTKALQPTGGRPPVVPLVRPSAATSAGAPPAVQRPIPSTPEKAEKVEKVEKVEKEEPPAPSRSPPSSISGAPVPSRRPPPNVGGSRPALLQHSLSASTLPSSRPPPTHPRPPSLVDHPSLPEDLQDSIAAAPVLPPRSGTYERLRASVEKDNSPGGGSGSGGGTRGKGMRSRAATVTRSSSEQSLNRHRQPELDNVPDPQPSVEAPAAAAEETRLCENDCTSVAAVDCVACKEVFCTSCDLMIHRGGRKVTFTLPPLIHPSFLFPASFK
jgi:hypothetical protein